LRLVLLVSAMVGVLLPVAAFAQTDNGTGAYPTVSTTPTTKVQGTVVTGAVEPAGTSSGSSLPITGGDVALLAVLGVGAVASGGAILLFTRRRSSTPSS
jgi:LPXTG-motif cell wall-anchored protein